ncbi:hypothetical protein [Motilimonas sp. KMU-193]|uniref:hypothetical protein n=1 Tax=Motilimonas sp. KMU-193 TaxID=3388668 RepID=UPI00396AFF14
MSLLHLLRNVGGIIFVSLFLLHTFMTQAETTPVNADTSRLQVNANLNTANVAPLHIELKK